MGSNLVKEPKKVFPADKQRRHDELMNRHMHNSAYGATVMAMRHAEHVKGPLKSATPEAKRLAAIAYEALKELAEELYTQRVEIDGRVVEPKHGWGDGSYGIKHRGGYKL